MAKILKLLCILSLLVGTPLLGLFLSGSPLNPYLEFPPTTAYTEPHSFSWLIFAILSLLMASVVFPFLFRFIDFSTSKERLFSSINFPWWGWGGLGFLLLSWTLAWSRFPWFQPFQNHTFTPLWIGYILVINALTVKRTGHCLLTEKSFFYLSLFPISAGFWWIFEFLNRFVQNWYYIGSIELTATNYFFAATIPFSTILPAVVGTSEYLGSFSRLRLPYQKWCKVPIPDGRGFGGVNLLVACIGLMGIGIWPNLLYPFLWLSPLIIFIGLQRIWGEKTLLEDIRNGDWSPVVLPGLAGLICGFFWELWNYYSLAHWKYLIPHVQAVQIFEMPLLGYFGYFPFGITCIVFVQFLMGEFSSPQLSSHVKHDIPFWGVQSSISKVQR
jgi:hypothetical protein